MRTIESQSAGVGSRWGRARRDLALLRRLASMVWAYALEGGRVRRQYRARASSGGTYWVDGDEATKRPPS